MHGFDSQKGQTSVRTTHSCLGSGPCEVNASKTLLNKNIAYTKVFENISYLKRGAPKNYMVLGQFCE